MEIALSQTNRRPKQSGTEWHARKLRLMTHDDSGINVKALVNEKLHALLYIYRHFVVISNKHGIHQNSISKHNFDYNNSTNKSNHLLF